MLVRHHTAILALATMCAAVGCRSGKSAEKGESTGDARPSPEGPAPLPPTPWTAAAIAHGGVGSPPDMSDGPRAAVDAALAVLEAGGDPVDAAVAGVVVLEDDPRFNAGTGSRVRIDGETVQMDAAVMSSAGAFGAVAVIERVKNPVKVARAVIDTPHILLAGDGATRFARTLGMEDYDPATEEMRMKTAEIIEQLRAGADELPASWKDFDYQSRWNFERSLEEAGLTEHDVGTDTVAVAVRTADGRFAAAISTGGTAVTLRGRVGDVPILGAGVFTGTHGAVAATGTGERIVEAGASRAVYERAEAGATLDDALAAMVERLDPKGSIGIISIGPTSMTAAADRPMAWAAREQGSDTWLGPDGDAVSK